MLDEETCTVSVTYLTLWTGFEPLLIEDECQKWSEFVGSSGSSLHCFVLRSESGAQRGREASVLNPAQNLALSCLVENWQFLDSRAITQNGTIKVVLGWFLQVASLDIDRFSEKREKNQRPVVTVADKMVRSGDSRKHRQKLRGCLSSYSGLMSNLWGIGAAKTIVT